MKGLTFAVFTDLHYDHIHDGERRLEEFIERVKKRNVDFIVGLGDICHPVEKNKFILDKLDSIGVPCYYAIGNHDSDAFSKEQAVSFLGMEKGYYSFIKGEVKLIVLDACYIKRGEEYIPYFKGNYVGSSDTYPYIPEEQLRWLEEELESEAKYFVIFSHHSLTNEFAKRGVANRREVRKILEAANKVEKRVLLCMNGHDHGDSLVEINGINYYTLNSMSYIWHGQKEVYTYPKEVHESYQGLKDMLLYKEGLHAIVTIESGKVVIEGMKGDYHTLEPEDVGIIDRRWNGVSVEPVVTSVKLK